MGKLIFRLSDFFPKNLEKVNMNMHYFANIKRGGEENIFSNRKVGGDEKHLTLITLLK